MVLGVLVLTVVNLAIVAVAGLGALHYMETDQFCGQVCHVPMKPEFTAHQLPPHASVDCVTCRCTDVNMRRALTLLGAPERTAKRQVVAGVSAFCPSEVV